MLKNEPYDSFLNYALALEYNKLDEPQKAIDLIEKLLDRDKNYLGAYYQLGKIYENNLQLDKARDVYNKGIIIAQQQKNNKTREELKRAILILDEE